MNSVSKYSLTKGTGPGKSDPLGTQSGVFLSGGAIFNSLAAGNKDAVEGEVDTLDTCLSHPTPHSQYHYHFWSGCAVKNYGFWHGTEAPALCRKTSGCTTAPATMTMGTGVNSQSSFFTKANWDKPIGIARDGHLIMGPYKDANGTRWSCSNRDVCNGAFIGNQYVYVGSDTFPYVVGCWGPGPKPDYKPCCSNTACGSKSECSSGAYQFGLIGASAAIAAVALF